MDKESNFEPEVILKNLRKENVESTDDYVVKKDVKKNPFKMVKTVGIVVGVFLILFFSFGVIYKAVTGRNINPIENVNNMINGVSPTPGEEKKEMEPTKFPGKTDEDVDRIDEKIKLLDKKSTEIDFSEPIFSYPELEMNINFKK